MGTPGLLCVKLRMNRHRIAAMTNESINRQLFHGAHARALYFLIKKTMNTRNMVCNLKQQSYKELPIMKYRVAHIEISFRW